MPFYNFINPKTGQVFQRIVSISKSDQPFVLQDGTVCQRDRTPQMVLGQMKKQTVYGQDAKYVQNAKPKFVRNQDGVRQRYDPTRHTAASGQGIGSVKQSADGPPIGFGSQGKSICKNGIWWKWSNGQWIKQKVKPAKKK